MVSGGTRRRKILSRALCALGDRPEVSPKISKDPVTSSGPPAAPVVPPEPYSRPGFFRKPTGNFRGSQAYLFPPSTAGLFAAFQFFVEEAALGVQRSHIVSACRPAPRKFYKKFGYFWVDFGAPPLPRAAHCSWASFLQRPFFGHRARRVTCSQGSVGATL